MGSQFKAWALVMGLTIGWILFSGSMLWGVDRLVVGELVTNTGCVYCFFADNELDRIFPLYPQNLILIRYHRNSPDPNDPYYVFNPQQNMERIDYYAMNGTPRFFVDGTYSHYFADYEDSIVSRMPIDSPLEIEMSGSLNQQNGKGFVNLIISAVGDMPSHPLNVRVALTESNLFYHAPNATFWHHQTFRGMLGSTEGDTVTMMSDSQYYFSYDFDFGDLGLTLGYCQFVAFVQDDTTREIYQGAKLNLISMPTLTQTDVEARPHSPEIIIPREGGTFSYTGSLVNNTAKVNSVDVWIMITPPIGAEIGPLGNFEVALEPFGETSDPNVTQEIPWDAPAGDFIYRCYVGHYPDDIHDSSRFTFRKECGIPVSTHANYTVCCWRGLGQYRESPKIADGHRLKCSPNPCNPISEVSFYLEKSEHTRLEIINILGEKIAILCDSAQPAGFNSFAWDGSNFSSGVYFAKLTMGGASSSAKIVLLK